uniref:NADH-ubiquinone oxidoreductase chain 3 n=1 Tax=Armadillidium album TaxID=96802 RepID=A0A1P8DKL3_9CRUS|nr:NADH dehydrogenase subunit 3 [Armadillidium album]
MLLLMSSLLFMIAFMLMYLSPLLGVKQDMNYEKSTPFESGFDPQGSGRLNFSVRFFLIAVVFLIFDVEIALLLPLMIVKLSGYYWTWGLLSLYFLLILTFGTIYEWKEGALDWKIWLFSLKKNQWFTFISTL